MGICQSGETPRRELIKDSFLSYAQASDLAAAPLRKPKINGAETAHTAYIADVQDYFRCLDDERARAFVEAREVSEEYVRFLEAVE